MRILLLQPAPTHLVNHNITMIAEMAKQAITSVQPDILMLPEMWSCLGGSDQTKIDAAEYLPPAPEARQFTYTASRPGRLYTFLSQMAREHSIYVHGGSIGERSHSDPEKLYNTSLVFSPSGTEIGRYRKMHLFDISTPDGHTYKESALYKGGTTPTLCQTGEITWGLSICYDLRFPNLYAYFRKKGAQCIALPAAFTYETGRDHWEYLLRARAIETQCWMLACATTGYHTAANGTQRQTYGHSMIIDPWGRVCAALDEQTGWISATIDYSVTAWARRLIPLASQHKLGPNGFVI